MSSEVQEGVDFFCDGAVFIGGTIYIMQQDRLGEWSGLKPVFPYKVLIDEHSGCLLRPVPPEMERPLGAGRLGLSHWAGPSVTRSAGWSQRWYGGIIVDILAKESKFLIWVDLSR